MFKFNKQPKFFLSLLLALAVLATGCLSSGGGGQTQVYDVTGTVVEQDTNVLLSGVTVEIGSKQGTTNTLGQFSLKGIPSGSNTLKASLEGYETRTLSINVTKNETIAVTLKTNAPLMNLDELHLASDGISIANGATIEGTTINVSGNINDLLGSAPSSYSMMATSNPKAEIILNGAVWGVDVDYSGFFSQELPVNPGDNTIQLRIRTGAGYSRTSSVITIHADIPRLDIRTIMAWDTYGTDVDLHVFKRETTEPNFFTLFTEDRHVYWSNDEPTDFGNGKENPFLDIDDTDGYGPETIVLMEATPGYYHIWVHAWRLDALPLTKTTVKMILDGGTTSAIERSFNVELPLELDYKAVYVTTVNVAPSGAKTFVQVEPTGENYEDYVYGWSSTSSTTRSK